MLHSIQRKNPLKKSRTVGRGGKRGKTSGKGHKGQKARAGHRIRPAIRDQIKKIPKMRGHGKNRAKSTYVKLDTVTVNVSVLEKNFNAGDTINPVVLHEKQIIQYPLGKRPIVKILAQGDITRSLTIEGCAVSEGARTKIEQAGGVIKE